MVKIKCPKCGRILGDTAHSLDARLNCPRCKATRVKITVYDHSDYVNNIKIKKGTESHGN